MQRFGEQAVFMDVAAIEPGRDFRKAIDEHVASCGVLLAVIGKHWTDAMNEAGQRRLDDALDFVRLETASALKRDIPRAPQSSDAVPRQRVESPMPMASSTARYSDQSGSSAPDSSIGITGLSASASLRRSRNQSWLLV